MQAMIDIERIFPEVGSPRQLIQVGVVSFDFGFKPQEALEILENPDRWLNILFEYENPEEAYDPSVFAFWAAPDRAAPRSLIDKMPVVSADFGLTQLSNFIKQFLGKRAMIWAKPPGFDLRFLRTAYWNTFPTTEDDATPWSWSQEACLRTLGWIADRVPRNKFKLPDVTSQGLVAHFGLHDAIEQTILAQGAYRALVEQARAK